MVYALASVRKIKDYEKSACLKMGAVESFCFKISNASLSSKPNQKTGFFLRSDVKGFRSGMNFQYQAHVWTKKAT